ncbi:MAG: hypothetical protein JSS43_04800 [Proteobacteria bacterium]|nr:hypothetical protein [Pseudomonadota bacterium]
MMLLSHALLIVGGAWHGDEYANFAAWRRGGISEFIRRLVEWSPRPASELPLYLYYLAVERFKAPLIAPFLATLWTIVIATAGVAAWQGGGSGLLQRFTLLLATLAMGLMGPLIGSLFFWPMGAAPYLLSLLGIMVVTLQILGGRTSSTGGQILSGCGLALAITSSEVGYFFAVSFIGTMLVLDAPRLLSSGRPRLWGAAWYLIPALLCAAVGAWILHIVFTNPMRGLGKDSPTFHDFWRSLEATIHGITAELTLGHGPPAGMDGPASRLAAGLLFAGFLWACRRGFVGTMAWRTALALLTGLVGCFLITIFASYYQYGSQAHETHGSFRHVLLVLILLVAARAMAPLWPVRGLPARIVGPAALAAAIVIAMTARAPALLADYRLIPEIRAARRAVWDSGLDRSQDRMRFEAAPSGALLIHMFPQPSGRYISDTPGTEWWMEGILRFFDKRVLEMAPRTQSSAS